MKKRELLMCGDLRVHHHKNKLQGDPEISKEERHQ